MSAVIALPAGPDVSTVKPRKNPILGRTVLGSIFFASAVYNAVYLPTHLESLRDLAVNADLALYRRFFLEWVLAWPLPFIAALVLFEIKVGALLFSSGRAVKVGLAAALAFLLWLVPLLGGHNLGNVPLAAIVLVGFRSQYPKSVAAELWSRITRAPEPS